VIPHFAKTQSINLARTTVCARPSFLVHGFERCLLLNPEKQIDAPESNAALSLAHQFCESSPRLTQSLFARARQAGSVKL
jgi:hypothetical protein